MRRPTIVRARARRQIAAVIKWYDEQREGLGDEFLVELDEMIKAVRVRPLTFRPLIGEVRRAGLRRLPYYVYFRVHPDRVEVMTVLHKRRGENP